MYKAISIIAISLAIAACSSNKESNIDVTKIDLPHSSIDDVEYKLRDQVRKLKTIDINGTKINLAKEDNGFYALHIGTAKTKVYNQAYSAIGHVLPIDVKTDKYGYLQDERVADHAIRTYGWETQFADIPKSGTATYTGASFGADTQGKLTLHADFGAAKITGGAITERTLLSTKEKLNDIELLPSEIVNLDSTAIQFGDAAKTIIDGVTVKTSYKGRFMGPVAEEVIGTILDGNNQPYETFGGKK